ncbi:MAG: glutamate synthase [Anaerolineae bacterium]|jgi:glutamate synthase domain-containing protein 1/glutamate synthase domain-containing protein 3|nr:glutamate synthase [Anaerolineae bacterium]
MVKKTSANNYKLIDQLLASRMKMIEDVHIHPNQLRREQAAEGGCGVVGMSASFPVPGRHFFQAAEQMHNRGNGKGGGIAAAGLNPAQMKVSPEVLRDATLLQIAYLDPTSRTEVEQACIEPNYDILQSYMIETIADYRAIEGLDVRPPDVVRYFVRAKQDKLQAFAEENGLAGLDARKLEDEYIYRKSFELNVRFYASLGEQRAFVLSHGRDLLVFKIVGYGEQAARYYKMEDMEAHVWIAHQRYPTKGRVWHPGGAHPFIGLNEALVHNGDFANYHAVSTYLRQRNIKPLFLTDTEISVLLFDLLDRVYEYPLEAAIESLAPTTERDFKKLPDEKKSLYRAIQSTHIHASPDGPWFFIIARSQPEKDLCQLLGITDTSMLRPQVFALVDAEADGERYQVGLIASEKQAIDATLKSLHAEIPAVSPVADIYWNARGGSYNDGGSFSFRVVKTDPNAPYGRGRELICTNKFGEEITIARDQKHVLPEDLVIKEAPSTFAQEILDQLATNSLPLDHVYERVVDETWMRISHWLKQASFADIQQAINFWVAKSQTGSKYFLLALTLMTRIRDRIFDPGQKRRASILSMLDKGIRETLDAVELFDPRKPMMEARFTWDTRKDIVAPMLPNAILVLDVADFPAEGDDGPGLYLAEASRLGWHHLISYNWRGQRFLACNLGPVKEKLRFDAYGSPGDYLASGLDGDRVSVYVHNNAQDQLAQIYNKGNLVIYGDTGQTFMYGAKGGTAFVRGNAAGRPLINAVGSPRVVINGTCLDYLAESFMAGNPLNGGGFVILNGIEFDEHGRMKALPEPYPGGNLFSLASGGAIYIRDPHKMVDEDQLNGGFFQPVTAADQELILPYLQQNEQHFGIPVDDLLTVNGERKPLTEVYRKVGAGAVVALH